MTEVLSSFTLYQALSELNLKHYLSLNLNTVIILQNLLPTLTKQGLSIQL